MNRDMGAAAAPKLNIRAVVRGITSMLVCLLLILGEQQVPAQAQPADVEQIRTEILKAMQQFRGSPIATAGRASLEGTGEDPLRFHGQTLPKLLDGQARSAMQAFVASELPENVRAKAAALAESGTFAEVDQFLQVELAQLIDDAAREQAQEISNDPQYEDSVLAVLADQALAAHEQGDEDALLDFMAEGEQRAQEIDNERKLYELADSDQPTLAAMAAEVLRTNDPVAVQEFIDYGQYIAMLHDVEESSVQAWSNIVDQYTASAMEKARAAEQRAENARHLARLAAAAADRAEQHAGLAGDAATKAASVAQQTSRLADAASAAADEASAAAADAHAALVQALDASSAAAALAAATEQSAAQALAAASEARGQRLTAEGARDDAARAMNAARAAQSAQAAAERVQAVIGHAQRARDAAGAAATAATQASGAARDAADQANETSHQAAIARAAADRSEAAAARARAAAQRVDGFVATIANHVNTIKGLVEQAQQHAAAAAREADIAARAAEGAAAEANEASRLAQEAAAAADRADAAAEIARKISDAAKQARDNEFNTRKQQVIDDAKKRSEQQQRYQQLAAEYTTTPQQLDDLVVQWEQAPEENKDQAARDLAFAAINSSEPMVRTVAEATIVQGSAEAYEAFADGGVEQARSEDKREQLRTLRDSAIGTDAAQAFFDAADGTDDDVDAVLKQYPLVGTPGMLDYARAQAENATKQAAAARDAGLDEQADSEEFAAEQWTHLAEEDQQRLATLATPQGKLAFIAELGRVEGYNNLENTGPQQSLAAHRAVYGTDSDAAEYWLQGRHLANALDAIGAGSEARVNALHQRIGAAVDVAHGAAARAQQAAAQAHNDAEAAAQHADRARTAAIDADESARQARASLESARADLDRALVSQQRAHQAARQATADAAQARDAAIQATNHEAAAFAAAATAEGAAQDARLNAEAAGVAAEQAESLMNEAVLLHGELQGRDIDQFQDDLEAGIYEEDSFEDLLKEIAKEVGPEVYELALDLIGYTDLRNCIEGEIGGCLMTALNFLPVGKIFKAAKAIPAVKRFIQGAKKVVEARKDLRIRRISKLNPCGTVAKRAKRTITGWRENGCKAVFGAGKAENVRNDFKLQVLVVDGRNMDTIEDMQLVAKWKKNSGLESPVQHDGTPFTAREKERLAAFSTDVTETVLEDGKPVYGQAARAHLDEAQSRIKKLSKSRSFDEHGNIVHQKVALDDVQNLLIRMEGYLIQEVRSKSESTIADYRVNQRGVSYDKGELKTVTTKKPDSQIAYANDGINDVVIMELDGGSGPRQMMHLYDALAARDRKDGLGELTIVFVRIGRKDVKKDLLGKIEKALKKDRSWDGFSELRRAE